MKLNENFESGSSGHPSFDLMRKAISEALTPDEQKLVRVVIKGREVEIQGPEELKDKVMKYAFRKK